MSCFEVPGTRDVDMRIAAWTFFILLSSVLLADNSEPVEAPTVSRLAKRLEDLGAVIEYATNAQGTRDIRHVAIRESWIGGDEGMDVVESLARLHGESRTLYIIGQPSISKARLDQFEKEVPNVSIRRRSAAQLGVGGTVTPVGTGFQIVAVKDDSPAEKSGLKQGDVITELDGEPVRDFQTLVELLLPERPGDTVTLTIRRNKRERSIDVLLDGW